LTNATPRDGDGAGEQTMNTNALEEPLDPHRLARHYLKKHATHSSGKPLLRFWQEEWWSWETGRYRKVTERELSVKVARTIKIHINQEQIGGKFLAKVSRNLVANVLQALASEVHVDASIEQPAWIGREPNAANYISLKNGLVDIDRAVQGDSNAFRAHTPDWFSPVQFPFDFDAHADCPGWRAFLEEVLELDSERIALMREWAGYLLTPDTSFQKFMVLEGEGANGKSVVLEVLGGMVGKRTCRMCLSTNLATVFRTR
jgi:putative DNA primase/helicase